MYTDVSITQEECEVVDNVVNGFSRKMKWNPCWEKEDIRQDLLIYWFQKKQNGWTKPEEWKGALGRCLLMYLISVRRKECAQKRQAESSMLSLDELIEGGWEFPDHKRDSNLIDFLYLLDRQERKICELLIQGYTKTEIALRLNISRFDIHRKIIGIGKLLKNIL